MNSQISIIEVIVSKISTLILNLLNNKQSKQGLWLMLLLVLSISLKGQTVKAISQDGRSLIKGGSTRIKIEPRHDSLEMKLSVSNGEIQEITSQSIIYRDKKMMTINDTAYSWRICESSKGFELLYIDYYKDEVKVTSDTIKFYTIEGPILKARVYKASSDGDSKEFKGLTPANIIGISFMNTNLNYGFKLECRSYEIEVYKKRDKLKRTLINKGYKINEDNREVLRSKKKGFIRITNIEAYLECGLKAECTDIEPIFY